MRQSHSRRLRLAISAHRTRHGWASDLRAKSALDFSAAKNSRRSVHRQHRLQHLSHTETRHPRVRAILFISQHPGHIRARSCRRGTLCLRHGYSSLFLGRTTFLTTSETPGTATLGKSTTPAQARSGARQAPYFLILPSAGLSARAGLKSHSRTPRPGSRGLMMPVILSQTAFTAGRTVSHGNAEPGFALS